MKKYVAKFQDLILFLSIFIINSPVWAALPTPPTNETLDGSRDSIDIGGSLVFKVLKISCYGAGAFVMIGVAMGVLKAYHTSQEKQDLGHFFKNLIVSVVVGAIGVFAIYAGYNCIPTDGKV